MKIHALERVAEAGDPFEFLGETYVYANKDERIKGDFNSEKYFIAR